MEKQFRQGRRRRMTKFVLNEISAVDAPAAVGARAVIMKRDGAKQQIGRSTLGKARGDPRAQLAHILG